MISDLRTATCDACGDRKPAAGDGLPTGWVLVDLRPVQGGHRHSGHACSPGCATRLTPVLFEQPHADCLDCRREGMVSIGTREVRP